MSSLIQELAGFAVETKFEELPTSVVHEAKRTLLDSMGCALASITTDKGKMSVALARRLGGPPESSIIGINDKVSCCSAAFANGELIMAMDYDALVAPTGHIAPHAIPPPLAIAESVDASGKDLILAVVLALEIATRVARAMKPVGSDVVHFEGSAEGSIRWPKTVGHAGRNIGATAGAGRLLKLDQDKMSHALGIAGHLCQVPVEMKFLDSAPSAMTKYASAGWQSTGTVIAALLAEMGYIGDTTVFDTDYGFGTFSSAEKWQPDKVMEGIGEKWYLLNMQYKGYPCCLLLQSALDCFVSVIDQNNLMPEDIESVKVFSHPIGELAACENRKIVTHIDAQFSVPYLFAVAAHRVTIGVEWQDLDTMRNPKILKFMKKVSYQAHPEYGIQRRKHELTSIGMVEVVAKGKTFREQSLYPRGAPVTGMEFTDKELEEKFRHNASRILTHNKIEGAVKALLELEIVGKISELMKLVG